MATYTKVLLSGSTNGKAIKVSATSTPGTTLHTATSGSSNLDEVWLYTVNSGSASTKLTIEWGETAAPDGNIEMAIPAESGLFCVVPGLLLQNGLVISAFAGTADTVLIHGYVNRITA